MYFWVVPSQFEVSECTETLLRIQGMVLSINSGPQNFQLAPYPTVSLFLHTTRTFIDEHRGRHNVHRNGQLSRVDYPECTRVLGSQSFADAKSNKPIRQRYIPYQSRPRRRA